MEHGQLVCMKCKEPLTAQRVEFSYLGHVFHAELPKCSVCGQVYVSEELALGKMSDVERELEDK